MKILITGATGFIGRYVLKEAIQGGYEVYATTRNPKATGKMFTDLPVTWLKYDFSDNETPNLNGLDLHAVIHLAASVYDTTSSDVDKTIQGTINLINKMREAAIPRLVGISSIAVIDYKNIPPLAIVDEGAKILQESEELSNYPKMKLLQEKIIIDYAENPGLSSVILRPGLVYDKSNLSTAHAGIINNAFCMLSAHKGQVPTVEVSGLAKAIINAVCIKNDSVNIFNIVDDNLPTQKEYTQVLNKRNQITKICISVHWRILFFVTFILRAIYLSVGKKESVPELLYLQGFSSRLKPFIYSNQKAKMMLGWIPGNNFL